MAINPKQSPEDFDDLYLCMNRCGLLSRGERALWIIKNNNVGQCISSEIELDDPKNINDIFLAGFERKIRKEFNGTKNMNLSPRTNVYYFCESVRMVFLLDFSPSTFVSDEIGSVLYKRIIDSFIRCIKNTVRKFKLPGNPKIFEPKIYLTLCAFTPFMWFTGNSVLLQGACINEENISDFITLIQTKIRTYIDKLISFSRPYLKSWYQEKHGVAEQNDLESDGRDAKYGFIRPDLALLSMIRMGIMGIQLLPPNMLSNIIIITDGICGIYNMQALQALLTQLRYFSISCSIIKLRQCGATLGLLAAPPHESAEKGEMDIFQFIAYASNGTFLTDEFESGHELELNVCHKAFLIWSFYKSLPIDARFSLSKLEYKRLSKQYETSLENLLYLRMREGFTVKHLDIQEQMDGTEKIELHLIIPWKPEIYIEYTIFAPWGNVKQTCKISVEISVSSTIYPIKGSLSEFIDRTDHSLLKTAILNILDADTFLTHLSLFNSDLGYSESFESFSTDKQQTPVFEYNKYAQRLYLNEKYESLRGSKLVMFWQPLVALDEKLWQKWIHTHTIRFILAHDLPIPDTIFSSRKGRFAQITSEVAFQQLNSVLRNESTFTLLWDQIYVKFIGEADHPEGFCLIKIATELPKVTMKISFFGGLSRINRQNLIEELKAKLLNQKIAQEIMFIDFSDTTRASFIHDIHDSPFHFFYKTIESQMLTVINKPLERLFIRYARQPANLGQIIRIENTNSRSDKSEMARHNFISKYLRCRREIWHFPPTFLKNANYIEYILHIQIRRLLNQGFVFAYAQNGIINLVRQHSYEKDLLCGIEQFILFQPTFIDSIERSNLIESLKHAKSNDLEHKLVDHYDEKFIYGERLNKEPLTPQVVTEHWTEQGAIMGEKLSSQEMGQTNYQLQESQVNFQANLKNCSNFPQAERVISMANGLLSLNFE